MLAAGGGGGSAGEDGGRGGGEGRILWKVVDTVVKRTEKFGGNFQDWKFRLDMARQEELREAPHFLGVAQDEVVFVAPCEKVTEENRGYNANLCHFLSQRTEEEAFDVVTNVMGQKGGEAWRKLCRRFSAKVRGKRLHRVRKCVNDDGEEAQRGDWHVGEVGDECEAFGGRLEGGVEQWAENLYFGGDDSQ